MPRAATGNVAVQHGYFQSCRGSRQGTPPRGKRKRAEGISGSGRVTATGHVKDSEASVGLLAQESRDVVMLDTGRFQGANLGRSLAARVTKYRRNTQVLMLQGMVVGAGAQRFGVVLHQL